MKSAKLALQVDRLIRIRGALQECFALLAIRLFICSLAHVLREPRQPGFKGICLFQSSALDHHQFLRPVHQILRRMPKAAHT